MNFFCIHDFSVFAFSLVHVLLVLVFFSALFFAAIDRPGKKVNERTNKTNESQKNKNKKHREPIISLPKIFPSPHFHSLLSLSSPPPYSGLSFSLRPIFSTTKSQDPEIGHKNPMLSSPPLCHYTVPSDFLHSFTLGLSPTFLHTRDCTRSAAGVWTISSIRTTSDHGAQKAEAEKQRNGRNKKAAGAKANKPRASLSSTTACLSISSLALTPN